MLHSNSRYIKTKNYVDGNGVVVPYVRNKVSFNVENCTKHRVRSGESLEMISYKELGSVGYKWCILDCNPRYLSELDIEAGDILLIPSITEVRNFYAK